jgi:hypothetical protein
MFSGLTYLYTADIDPDDAQVTLFPAQSQERALRKDIA